MKIRNYILTMASVLCFTACDYEEINMSTTGVTDEELKQNGLMFGIPFMNMQQKVIPIGSPSLTTGPGNDLQNTDLISSGNYIGYFGNNNNWNNKIEATWNFDAGRMGYAMENFYSKVFQSWIEIHNIVKDSELPSDKAVAALSNIVKIMAWSRATDVFGPIAYTSAGSGAIAPKFDSQEVVYKSMLSELESIVAVLKDAPSILLPQYDLIYGGNTAQWIKLANSMMLRLAVRCHFKDEALAREYITKALNPVNGGVMEVIADEAKIGNCTLMPLKNSMMASVEEYGETRMGSTIWSYLMGYKDSRIYSLFTQVEDYWTNDKIFMSLPPTNDEGKSVSVANKTSKPIVSDGDPLYWMRASEVYFLRAEAALYGLAEGNVKDLYEAGVRTSFEEMGADGVNRYLECEELPKNINRKETGNYWYSCRMTDGNTSPKWDDIKTSNTKEEQLQKIMTQKYIALYPNAVEAWTEYRRTGYPYLCKPADSQAYSRIGAEYDAVTPERFRFSPNEYTTNPNMEEIPTLLGGPDQGATPLWWVRPGRPKQPKN